MSEERQKAIVEPRYVTREDFLAGVKGLPPKVVTRVIRECFPHVTMYNRTRDVVAGYLADGRSDVLRPLSIFQQQLEVIKEEYQRERQAKDVKSREAAAAAEARKAYIAALVDPAQPYRAWLAIGRRGPLTDAPEDRHDLQEVLKMAAARFHDDGFSLASAKSWIMAGFTEPQDIDDHVRKALVTSEGRRGSLVRSLRLRDA